MKNTVLLALLLFFEAASAAQAQSVPLLLYGGVGHKTFLGCFFCEKSSIDSICNKFGQHGSKFTSYSIWNKNGDFGSRNGDQSPWNRNATNPPIILDGKGKSYGYFTANPNNWNRTTVPELVALTDLWEKIVGNPDPVADNFCARH